MALAADAELVAWSERSSRTCAGAARRLAPVRLHVKLDTGHGAARHARRAPGAGGRRAGARGVAGARAGGRDDALRDRRRRPRVHGSASSTRSSRSSPSSAALAGHRRARRQQRRDAARAAQPLRPGPLRDRDLRLRSDERGSRRARARARARAALIRRGGQARARRATAPATAGGSSPSARPGSRPLPIGYADGIRRALTNNCDVLIGGRRYPLVGTVSMDNITVDLGPEPAPASRRRGDDHRP